MGDQITISIWVFGLLVVLALAAVLDRVLIPSTRWFLRRRINRVIDEIGTRLDIEIRPFQLTKRQVLIDRLAFDPKVIAAVQDYAREHEMDLIVIATHGHGALASMLLGSVTEKVVRKSSCPVLTVRHPEHKFEIP